jgi:phage replication-related protein YjqB (UPF0714/DUF867 family)
LGNDNGDAMDSFGGATAGRDDAKIHRLRESLEQSGFAAQIIRNPRLEGRSVANICNRGMQCAGAQLELSEGMRHTFFSRGEHAQAENFRRSFRGFVAAVRRAVA